MLLGDRDDLGRHEAEAIERDDSEWYVQKKRDDVRALLQVTPDGVRATGRLASSILSG